MIKGEPCDHEPTLQESILYIKVGNNIYIPERPEKEKDEEE